MINLNLNSTPWPANATEAAMPTPKELAVVLTEPPVDRDVAAANRRVRQLEKLNATLAAELDAQRPVVEAARVWRHVVWEGWPKLANAVDTYERGKGNG